MLCMKAYVPVHDYNLPDDKDRNLFITKKLWAEKDL